MPKTLRQTVAEAEKAFDEINRPAHYAEGRDPVHEPIAVIEAWGLGYCLGNCVKYISRAGRKDSRLKDLQKARWYLNREISRLEQDSSEQDG